MGDFLDLGHLLQYLLDLLLHLVHLLDLVEFGYGHEQLRGNPHVVLVLAAAAAPLFRLLA